MGDSTLAQSKGQCFYWMVNFTIIQELIQCCNGRRPVTVITGMLLSVLASRSYSNGRVPSKGLRAPTVSTIPVSQGECVSECESEVVP